VLWLTEGLLRLGHEVLLLAPQGELARRARAGGVPIRTLPSPGPWNPMAVRELVRTIRSWRPDLVHLHTSHAHNLGMLAKGFCRRTRYVVSRRVALPVRKGPKYGDWVARFIAVSQAVRRMLISGRIPPERISVVYSGVPVGRLAAAPPDGDLLREIWGSEDRVLAGNASALTKEKDHPTLLRAFEWAVRRYSGLRLIIAGDGPLRGSLMQLKDDLGLGDKVRFLGFRDGTWRMLKVLDVFVVSSKEEGLGVSLIEAMACGLPVVATGVGGIPEVVLDGETGILVPLEDPKALGEALVLLSSDRTLRKEMGKRAKERAWDFDVGRMVRGTEMVYREVVGW